MQIVVSDLPSGGRRFSGTAGVTLPAAPVDDSFVSARPVAYGLWAIRDGAEVHIRGWLSTTMGGCCARCLKATSLYVRREFEVAYADERHAPRDEEVALDEEDLDLDYYRDDVVDLRALLVEQLLLSLPMKLLCREDCRGLCPGCGIDRNADSCDCVPETDPRLAPLAALRDHL